MRPTLVIRSSLVLLALVAYLSLGAHEGQAAKSESSKQSASSSKQSSQSNKSKQQRASDHQEQYEPATQSKKQDKRVADWLRDQKRDLIELVSAETLELLIENMKHLVVVFYDQQQCSSGKVSSNKCKKIMQELENIDDDTDDHGIQFVKCEDTDYAKSLGINSLPALVYFEQHSSAPSIYVGDLEEEDLVLEWLVKQKNEDTIENINRDILQNLITRQQKSAQGAKKKPIVAQKERDYIAVLFYRHQDDESDAVMEQLESIDDDLSEYDVHLVKLADDLIAKKYGIRHPPGLVLFRHGSPLKYPGDLMDTDELLHWLTMPDNLETKDSIESVNEKMFHRFLKESKHLAILFHSQLSANCKQCPKVMEELEEIDDELSELGIRFIKVDNAQLARKYGVHALPSLVFINKDDGSEQASTIYAGDLKKGQDILQWLTEQKSPHLHQIPELNAKQCRELIKSKEHLAIYLYSDAEKGDDDDDDDDDDEDDNNIKSKNVKSKSRSNVDDDEDDDDDDDGDDDDDDEDSDANDVLEGLENIDSECRRQSIDFVKTKDRSFIKEFGLDEDNDDLPALIYFEHGQPSIYEGDLRAEEDLLDWLLKQKREDTIEEVNKKLLERLIESSHYLVVLFYKSHCKSCQTVLETLERIDDDCDSYGINMVKINDMSLAKRYGIKTFPALVYFRNGNPLIYSGDLKDDNEVLDWLLDDDQRELNDEIEDINGRMLDKLIESSPFLAALFYDDDCGNVCHKVLHELEKIDDDTDLFGIDFVKINDFQAARKYNVHNFPTLVYFRKQTPSYYDGDLLDEENVLSWLTSNDVFELEDEIEEVNKKMLDKLLATSDYIAVYFYDKNCKHCDEVLKELEHIDDEADSLGIMFVKIRDMNYAKKFGITQAPSLVYFRKKFPSIYRGDLMKEEKVLEWLRKNRYRNPELNLFMYALFTITISFILYTIFLMFCVKKKKQD